MTKKVAVKLPHDDQVNFDSIRQEATLWEEASGHPNVLPIIDADVYDGQVVIVSEYANGGSLADKLKTEGKLSLTQAVEMTIGVLSGLDYLHNKKIIHRDIKPQNILLQGDTPRLADFGISRAMQTTTISSTIVGTDAYMSPESFQGKRNVQTDIWSVGVLLYALLADNLPFPQEHPSERMYSILTTEPEPLSNEITPKLREIVRKALAKQPENRYQSAKEMREDLQKVLVNINHPTFAPTEILHHPIAPDFQTEDLPTVKTDEPVFQANQTERLSEQQTPKPVQPTQPAIEQNVSAEPQSIVTQINSQEIDENPKPLPTVAQAFADRPTASRKNNPILYYAGAGIVGLILLLGVFALYNSKGSIEKSTNSNKTGNSNKGSAFPVDKSILIPYLKKDKYGFSTSDKKLVIDAKYDNAYPFSADGLAAVKLNNKWGFVDKTGKEIVPPKYDEIYISEYSEGNAFSDGRAQVKLNNKWGFIDTQGNEVIPFKYDNVESYFNGFANVELDGKWGIIDKQGNAVVPFKYYYARNFREELSAVRMESQANCGFVDKQGREVIPLKYSNAFSFHDGLAAVAVNGKYGFIDKQGKTVIPFKYEFAERFTEGLAYVKLNGKTGYIDEKDNVIIPFKYNSIAIFYEGLAAVRLNGKEGYIDKQGNMVIPAIYDMAYSFQEGLAQVRLSESGNWGFIDKQGKEVTPFKYSYPKSFIEGLARVSVSGVYNSFYIDKNGTEYYEP